MQVIKEGVLKIRTSPSLNTKKVLIQDKAELDKWLQETLHPVDRTTTHVHILDCGTPFDLSELYTELRCVNYTAPIDVDVKELVNELVNDIKSLSLFTDGVLLSWCGRQTMSVSGEQPQNGGLQNTTPEHGGINRPRNTDLHTTFCRLFKDPVVKDFKEGKSVVVTLDGIPEEKGDVSSPWTHHQLQLASTDRNLLQFIWQTFVTTSKKDKDARPVVCVLMGGDSVSLKTAAFAVSKNTPVIIMKGSGGFADLLAWLHEVSPLVPRRKREQGKVIRIYVPEVEEDIMTTIRSTLKKQPEVVKSLNVLTSKLHLLSVYSPKTDKANRNMDSAILRALMKHNQDAETELFLETMNSRQKIVRVPTVTCSQTLVGNTTQQLELLFSILSRSPGAVSSFLSHLTPTFSDFHLGMILELYKMEIKFLQKTMNRDGFSRFEQARKDLKKYAGNMFEFPLRCQGANCEVCKFEVEIKESKDRCPQTCLHPIHELFLWSLLSGNRDLTETFWKYCDDKMAAALFARAVFLGMKKGQDNVDVKRELEGYARHFEDLAVRTLQASYELDENKTEELINKTCPWWGNTSPLQLALLTKSKLFFSQPCYQHFTQEWNGYLVQEPQDDSSKANGKSDRKPFYKTPKFCYGITVVWQMCFLLLYSYLLLFDLSGTLSPVFVAVILWVTDTACEEMKQVMKKTGDIWMQVKTYWLEKWNKLDVVSIGGFFLGMILVVVPNQHVHKLGRVVLAADIFVFFLRFMQIFMVFNEVGLLIVMAEKMVKDSVRFMVLLLTVMLGYAVASESVLYPNTPFTLLALYRLPAKAFWQSFGELGLEEIQGDKCEEHGLCPSQLGKYLVPVMVAIYVIISHVLLLNLLIAKFNSTYEEVKHDAEHHQAWQRCQLVEEYKSRSPLPPPFNILRLLKTSVVRCIKCISCDQKQTSDPKGGASTELESNTTVKAEFDGKCVVISSKAAMTHLTVELLDANQDVQSTGEYSAPKGTQHILLWQKNPIRKAKITIKYLEGERKDIELFLEDKVSTNKSNTTVKAECDGKCVVISSKAAMKHLKVELLDANQDVQSTGEYSAPEGTQHILLWQKKPIRKAKITITYLAGERKDIELFLEDKVSTDNVKQWQLQRFENEQADFVLSKKVLVESSN